VAQATLDLIESAADRVAILKGLFGAEVGKVPVSTRRVTECRRRSVSMRRTFRSG
jgi:hypothetical protein